MFICQITGLNSQLNEKPNKIVIETRPRTYTRRFKNEETREWETHEVATGTEIVKEIIATDAGLREWNEMSPDQQADFVTALKSA